MKAKGWKEIPTGGKIIKAGNSEEYRTGSWRTFRPIVDRKKCINCLFCWLYCPDASVKIKDGKVVGIDLDHCKGCGICAKECPVKCIKMVQECDLGDSGE